MHWLRGIKQELNENRNKALCHYKTNNVTNFPGTVCQQQIVENYNFTDLHRLKNIKDFLPLACWL